MSKENIISCIIAVIVSFLATPLVKMIAFRVGAVDVPKDERRIHKKPIARLGGLAIILATVVTMFVNIVLASITQWNFKIGENILGVVVGCSIIAVIGIIDDIKPQKAKLKLIFQVIAAICVVFVSNIRVQAISNPFSSTGVLVLNYYVSCFITICWLIGITNAINLIDGLDGLAAGISALSYLAMFLISVILSDVSIQIVTIILAGAVIGFLPHNFNPAKIFMGDTGSTFLGFTLAVISVSGTLKSYAAISIIIPVLILGVPLFDTTFAILRRICSGKSIMEADRGHIHHKLMDMGFSQKQVVLLMYLASAILGVSAVLITKISQLSILMTAVFGVVIVLAISKLIADVLKTKRCHKKR